VLTDHVLVSACVGEALHLLLSINPTLPVAPASVVPLVLSGYGLPLLTNVIVTTLIATRNWYLSPRNARNMRGAQFPTRTGQAAIDIVIESGMLYLAVQLVFVILFAIRHPAQAIVAVIAVQIYVRISSLLRERIVVNEMTQNHTGYRTDFDSYPRCSWLVEYSFWTDSQWRCINRVASYVVNASAC
jgi:hypothetical protein